MFVARSPQQCRMKKQVSHIIYRTLGILLVVLSVAKAGAQEPVVNLVFEQCDTIEFSVVDMPGDRYTWDIYDDYTLNFAHNDGRLEPGVYFVNGDYEGSNVRITGMEPGIYVVRIVVWDEEHCASNIKIAIVEIKPKIPQVELVGTEACIGDPTSVRIIFTGTGPYTIQYTIGDALTPTVVNINGNVENPEVEIPITEPLPVGETSFWLISVEDGCKAYEFPVDERPRTGIIIHPKPTNSKIYVKDQ